MTNINGLYEHYKGTRHRVLGHGRHSETLEELVFYTHEDTGALWARPYAMFFEQVEVAGAQRPRFIKIGE